VYFIAVGVSLLPPLQAVGAIIVLQHMHACNSERLKPATTSRHIRIYMFAKVRAQSRQLSLQCLCIVVMIANGQARPSLQLGPHVCSQLVSHGATKTSVASILQTLWKNGLIKDDECDDVDAASLKRQLTAASTQQANEQTPYGPLVQHMDLGIKEKELKNWEYINPFAWLYLMAWKSLEFSTIMQSICVEGRPLRIIIFADGMIPGNPFRPEKSRTLMCIYWCIVDWPGWLLTRSFAWPVFSILRAAIIEQIPGGLGYIMRRVLRIFFGDVGFSFRKGVTIKTPQGDVVVTAIFAGFLADLVGHKEITNWKGHGGVMCCLECGNVLQFRTPKAGQVSFTCWDRTKFKLRTDDEIYMIIDDLKRCSTTLAKTKFASMETDCGFNYDPHGLLFDVELRGVYKPGHHTIRDWMHTCGQDGLANTHVACAMHALADHGIPGDRIREFADACHYPSKWGKLDKCAFSERRLKGNTITSFASIILTMVPVFHMFLEMFVATSMPEHLKAFTYLHHMVGLLRLGPEKAMLPIDSLRQLIVKHAKAMVDLYGDDTVKPKAHHMHHVIDGMQWVGKLLACFVTERKHRDVKRSALHIFRHMEHTVLVDIVNKSFQQLAEGIDLYKEAFLVRAKTAALAGQAFHRSKYAVLHIGAVQHGDIVINEQGIVGAVAEFWQQGDGHIFAAVDAFECIDDNPQIRAVQRSHRVFFEASTIVDSLIWVEESPAIVRVSLPPALLYAAV